jgi:DNA-binding transcriptional ArsR family regulator
MTTISPEAARIDHETLRALLRVKAAAECATFGALAERVPGTRVELRLALRRLRAAGLVTIGHRDVRLTMLGLVLAAASLPRAAATTPRRAASAGTRRRAA